MKRGKDGAEVVAGRMAGLLQQDISTSFQCVDKRCDAIAIELASQ